MTDTPKLPPLKGPLLLDGCGKMGGAMLTGWLKQGLSPADVLIQDPGPPPEIARLIASHGILVKPQITADDLKQPPSVMLVAVKPQVMDQVFPTLARLAAPGTLTLSVAAGKTIKGFETHLAKGSAVVRTIPNTPAAIGRGITACVANAHVSGEQRALVDALLSAIGEVGWVENEGLIDVATAVSGSGPAYVFLLAECLAEAGRRAGLDAALARRLADATVSGAGELMRQSEDEPAQLRRNVTSPNGTTQAALEVLMRDGDGLGAVMIEAVEAATKRSRELAS